MTKYIYPGNLPEDMQVLLMQLATEMGWFGDSDAEMKRLARVRLPLMEIPLEWFPEIDPESDDMDERDFDSYLETPIKEYPPVVIAHEHFIDGRHRVWAAREQGLETIQTIDISCLVDSTLIGVGPMKIPRGVRIQKCKAPR